MRIVPWDRLPRSLDPQRVALELAAFSGYVTRRTVGILRRRWPLLSDYVGLFALEEETVVGQLLIRRLPFRTAAGVERVAGIASVTTRFDAQRRGVARALVQEAHRREAAAGMRFALLWTNPSWYAHRLYEELGYRDVWSSPSAVRLLPRRRPSPRGLTLRPATPSELGGLEALHAEVARDDTGFSPRLRGFLREGHAAGYLDLEGLLVLRRRGERLGYAVVAKGHDLLRCGEIVAPRAAMPAMLDALEARASHGVLALGNTPVRALDAELRRRGYFVQGGQEWRALMAVALAGPLGPAELREELGVDRPTFRCMSLDRF